MTTTRYRVYFAPMGSGLTYCGEFAIQAQAQSQAERSPSGTEAAVWSTLIAAGGYDHRAPDPAGTEDEEPVSWAGDYCVIRTLYRA